MEVAECFLDGEEGESESESDSSENDGLRLLAEEAAAVAAMVGTILAGTKCRDGNDSANEKTNPNESTGGWRRSKGE